MKQTIGTCPVCRLLVDASHTFRKGRGNSVMHDQCIDNLRSHRAAATCGPQCRCHDIQRSFFGPPRRKRSKGKRYSPTLAKVIENQRAKAARLGGPAEGS